MSATKKMWLWVVLLPVLTFLGLNMCVWPGPRFLGAAALMLLWFSALTVLVFLVAMPAALWFAATGLVYRKKEGELIRRVSKSLACVSFAGLWVVALWLAQSIRHQAFVEASFVGNRVVQALASYRMDRGEYPGALNLLVPQYIDAIPYTGMIAYPEFTYRKDDKGIQASRGEYELRINCPSAFMNFDTFIFRPSGDYSDLMRDNGVERICAWAYVHE